MKFVILFLVFVGANLVLGQVSSPSPTQCMGQPVVNFTKVLSLSSKPVDIDFVAFSNQATQSMIISFQHGLVLGYNKFMGEGEGEGTFLVLDITQRTFQAQFTNDERGILAVAFHPLFTSNGRFFVWFSENSSSSNPLTCTNPLRPPSLAYINAAKNLTTQYDHLNILAEFVWDFSSNTSTIVREILVIPMPFPNHNGHMLEFGSDSFLYLGIGDGGCENDKLRVAQNPSILLGKIWKINVDNNQQLGCDSIVASINDIRTNCPTLLSLLSPAALGVQNPAGSSISSLSTNSFLSPGVFTDDGLMFEELNPWIISSSTSTSINYGWPTFEGDQCTINAGYAAPTCNLSAVFPIAQIGSPFGFLASSAQRIITNPIVYNGNVNCLRGNVIFGISTGPAYSGEGEGEGESEGEGEGQYRFCPSNGIFVTTGGGRSTGILQLALPNVCEMGLRFTVLTVDPFGNIFIAAVKGGEGTVGGEGEGEGEGESEGEGEGTIRQTGGSSSGSGSGCECICPVPAHPSTTPPPTTGKGNLGSVWVISFDVLSSRP